MNFFGLIGGGFSGFHVENGPHVQKSGWQAGIYQERLVNCKYAEVMVKDKQRIILKGGWFL